MKTSIKKQKDSKVILTVVVAEATISKARKAAITELRPQVKAQGFRDGKAPDKIVEKQVGEQRMQQEVLDRAISEAYSEAVDAEQLRVLGHPHINITKFVPYSDLEFEATIEVMPDFELPDFKKIKVPFQAPKVEKSEVDEVLDNLRIRVAETKEVKRAAKEGDKVWIDFKGVRASDKSEVVGASGQDYPLVLGSDTFIKGFEPEIIGMKPGEEKTFVVTFPADYNVKALQKEKVEFTATMKKVEEVNKPKLDDKFAKQAGPFDSLDALKKDINAQLLQEKQEQAQREHRQKILEKLVDTTKLDPPPDMLARVQEQLESELKQNVQYRGMSLEQYVEQNGFESIDDFKEKELKPQSIKRAKSSLILTKVAEQEQIKVQREELDQRLAQLTQQYQDPQMRQQLDSPEGRREIAAQMLTEKTIAKLTEYAT